jgi:hypothetical protein
MPEYHYITAAGNADAKELRFRDPRGSVVEGGADWSLPPFSQPVFGLVLATHNVPAVLRSATAGMNSSPQFCAALFNERASGEFYAGLGGWYVANRRRAVWRLSLSGSAR